MTLTLPKAAQAFLDSRNPGSPHPAYRRWMEDVTQALNGASTSDELAELIAKLGSTDGTIAGIPDPNESQLLAGVGIAITNGNTIGLRPLADSGVGAALVKTTRDGYGRVSGTEAATAADLAYDNAASGLTAEDVQAALDEIASGGAGDLTPDEVPTDLAIYLVDSDGNYVRTSDGRLLTFLDATAQFWRLFRDREWEGSLTLELDGVAGGYISVKYSDDNTGPQARSQKARGSAAAPAAVASGDTLMSYQARGWHSGGAFSGNVGAVDLKTSEAFTASAQGTVLELSTVTLGTTTRAVRLQIDSDGVFPGATNAATLGSTSLVWGGAFIRNITRSGAMFETSAVTPTALAANVDDWVITGLGTAAVIRASATGAARTITGIASPTAGQRVQLINVGTFDLVLSHNVTSTAANRFICPGSVAFTLNPNDSVSLWYDTSSSRWRVLGV